MVTIIMLYIITVKHYKEKAYSELAYKAIKLNNRNFAQAFIRAINYK